LRVFTFPFPPSDNTAYPTNFKTGRRYLSAKGKTYKETIRMLMLGQEATDDYYTITLTLYPPDKRVRDVGNFDKLTLDAMTGLIYTDDVQVKELHTYMKHRDKENPRAEVTVDVIKW